MTRAFARSDRIGQVERLLLASRVPLSQAEIARRCEVHRSTRQTLPRLARWEDACQFAWSA